MTYDELIEAGGMAIFEVSPDRKAGTWFEAHFQTRAKYRDLARAAISVIAPAVLEEALKAQRDCEYPTDLPQWAVRANISRGDYVCAWEDGSQAVEEAIRALKTRYEQ